MALPKQIKFDLSREEYKTPFSFTEGYRAEKSRYWALGIAVLLCFATLVVMASHFIAACGYVNSQIDYSSFALERLNVGALVTEGCLLVILVTGFITYMQYLTNQTAQLFDAYYDRFHSGIVVMGNESFLFRDADGKEVTDLYRNLYEAHENEDYFLLVTYDDEEIPVPKKDMDRDTYGRISMLLTEQLGVYFFKFRRSNLDITKHTLFGERDKRKEIKRMRQKL